MRTSSYLVPLAVLVGGCGLLLDVDPDLDGGAGADRPTLDAPPRADRGGFDAGPEVSCSGPADCEDGLFCNGREGCVDGVCRTVAPAPCNDRIACTADDCDESLDTCIFVPDDRLCPTSPCSRSHCDPEVGCATEYDDTLCTDDGIDCTVERCLAGVCEHVPEDTACAPGQFCDPAAGCRPIVGSCDAASDCPRIRCNEPPTCEDGTCRYVPQDADPTCTSPDPCQPASCVSGRCVLGASIPCPATTSDSCFRNTCVRSADGTVACDRTNRDGEVCTGLACGSGTCVGNTCVDTACGMNATCDPAAGSCDCNAGFWDCDTGLPGCECRTVMDAGTTICPPGFTDCNGDGMCECALATSYCGPTGCVPAAACPICPTGRVCCDCVGACYDMSTPCPCAS